MWEEIERSEPERFEIASPPLAIARIGRDESARAARRRRERRESAICGASELFFAMDPELVDHLLAGVSAMDEGYVGRGGRKGSSGREQRER